jgi:hypothetical protein
MVHFRNSLRVVGQIASKDSQLVIYLEFLRIQYYRGWTEEAWFVHAELSMMF